MRRLVQEVQDDLRRYAGAKAGEFEWGRIVQTVQRRIDWYLAAVSLTPGGKWRALIRVTGEQARIGVETDGEFEELGDWEFRIWLEAGRHPSFSGGSDVD